VLIQAEELRLGNLLEEPLLKIKKVGKIKVKEILITEKKKTLKIIFCQVFNKWLKIKKILIPLIIKSKQYF